MLMDVARARRILAERRLDGLVALGPENVTYLTGYDSWTVYTFRALDVYALLTAEGAAALVAPVDAIDYLAQRPADTEALYTYGTFHVARSPGVPLADAEHRVAAMREAAPHDASAPAALRRAVADLGLAKGRIGFDTRSPAAVRCERLRESLPGVRLEPADEVFADLRRVKTEAEIDHLRHAAQVVEDAIQRAFGEARPGGTEADLASTIAAATAARHVTPGHCETSAGTRGSACFPFSTERRLAAGDVIRSDCGGRYRGYWADTGRTAVLGEPPEALDRCFAAVHAGIEAMLSAVRPGVPAGELFTIGVQTVRDNGIGHYQRHHAGHGIGLDMYEPPLLVGVGGSADIHASGGPGDVLAEGMVLNVELPYYELGLGGVQIEETLVVRADGYELLTRAPRGMRRIPVW
jgi:Xaa-Pro dipeptidase